MVGDRRPPSSAIRGPPPSVLTLTPMVKPSGRRALAKRRQECDSDGRKGPRGFSTGSSRLQEERRRQSPTEPCRTDPDGVRSPDARLSEPWTRPAFSSRRGVVVCRRSIWKVLQAGALLSAPSKEARCAVSASDRPEPRRRKALNSSSVADPDVGAFPSVGSGKQTIAARPHTPRFEVRYLGGSVFEVKGRINVQWSRRARCVLPSRRRGARPTAHVSHRMTDWARRSESDPFAARKLIHLKA